MNYIFILFMLAGTGIIISQIRNKEATAPEIEIAPSRPLHPPPRPEIPTGPSIEVQAPPPAISRPQPEKAEIARPRPAQTANADYKKTLQKMFEVSETDANYKLIVKDIIELYKKQPAYARIANDVWAEIEAEFMGISTAEIDDALVPIYSKHLSIEDLQEIIKFYESPIGQKLAKSQAPIMQESLEVGRAWGEKVGDNLIKKLKAKGY